MPFANTNVSIVQRDGATSAMKQTSMIDALMNSANSRIKSAATTNATSAKVGAATLKVLSLHNNSAAAKFVKFYDKASAPVVGTDVPVFTVALAVNESRDLVAIGGIWQFTLGIAYAITNLVADTDTTAVALDDVHGSIAWL